MGRVFKDFSIYGASYMQPTRRPVLDAGQGFFSKTVERKPSLTPHQVRGDGGQSDLVFAMFFNNIRA
jgi:hypothetical protein